MRLSEISKAVQEIGKPNDVWSLLIYGQPKIGKTRLAATIARVPYIRNIHWFDLENGSETLVTMARRGELTEEQAAKIIVYGIPDTKDSPMAFATMTKALTVRKDHMICYEHGRINCEPCAEKNDKGQVDKFTGQPFNLNNCTKDDVVVIDSGNALAVSVLNYYLRGKSIDYKPGWDEYGPQGLVLTDCCLVIQSSRKTNFIVTTHELSITTEENDKEIDRYYPVMGTKNFSLQCAKYFTHIAYLEKRLGKHAGGTDSLYRKDIISGSRGGWRLEDHKELDLALLFAQLKGS